VSLIQNGREFDATFSADGTLVIIETGVEFDTVPASVRLAVTRAADGARIKDIERGIVHSQITLQKLKVPMVLFEAEVVKDGQEI